ncbi:MAG: GtrA family protein [Dermatophilaceae bacterium]
MTSRSQRGPLPQQILRFAGAGALATVLNLVSFAALARSGVATRVANGVSLVISTIVNTAINRRWTFQITGQERFVVQQGQVLAILAMRQWIFRRALR